MSVLFDRVNAALPLSVQLVFPVRLVTAAFLGGVIGLERAKRLKEAGVRTHCLVALSAALFMIISKYGFTDLAGADGTLLAGLRGADPSRIAANVISVVSFIGLAVIYRNGRSLTGLTTAASIWATTGVGLAVGTGLYLVGLAATVIIIIIQSVLHHYNIGNDSLAARTLCFVTRDTPASRRELIERLAERHGLSIVGSRISRNHDGTVSCRFSVRGDREESFAELLRFFDEHPDVTDITF